jgi:hypothetical protein
MKRSFILILFFLVAASCGSRSTNAGASGPSDTWIMIVGVLKWENPGLSPFSDVNRKDKELYDLYVKQGIPKEHSILLLDEEATLKNIKKSLEGLLAKIPKNGNFVFYYAGHGMKEKNGDTYFANYDINTAQAESTGLSVSWIGETIRNNFKGNMVWLTADCCYSGSLIGEGKKMNNIKTLVSTSATASNSSTENWTFTQTMIDCLSGLPYADHNNDGNITVSEWQKELGDAMKFREKQRNGFALFGVGNDEVISKTSGKTDKSDTEYPSGSYAQAFYEQQWQAVRILGKSNGKYNCEFYHYSDKEDIELPADKLKKMYFVIYPEKSKVQVLWGGEYWDAEILKSEDGFHYITYPGYESYWDEWVMYDRIKTGKEKHVEVEWNGKYYPALVLEEKNKKYFIHYTDDSYDWDEWVGNDRIRFNK